jgi:SAM-dependent methyltransferase
VPSIYARPALYEEAFSFRDVPAEVDAILNWTGLGGGRALELAAGPAAHSLELARRGLDVTALDLSPAMIRHASRRAKEAGVALAVATGDMSQFALGRRFGLILTMAGAVGHLGDDRALRSHFGCVARHLGAGGVYVIETSPPGDVGTRDRWRLSRHGRQFDVRFSPRRLTIRVRHPDGRAQTFSDALGLRLWTAGQLAEAAARAGLGVVQRHRRLAGQSRMVLVFGR